MKNAKDQQHPDNPPTGGDGGKCLLLVRHAKSSWGDFSIKDFDRSLNDRGKSDAPMMAQRLLDREIKIDAFIASPAKRARKTAELFVKQYKANKEQIIFLDSLYLAGPSIFSKVISETDDQFDTIAVFSHNDGITAFANTLTNTKTDNMPTCGIFAIKIKAKQWRDFPAAEKEFWFFDYPKNKE